MASRSARLSTQRPSKVDTSASNNVGGGSNAGLSPSSKAASSPAISPFQKSPYVHPLGKSARAAPGPGGVYRTSSLHRVPSVEKKGQVDDLSVRSPMAGRMDWVPMFNPQVEKERLQQMQKHKELASQLDSQQLDELDHLRNQINTYQAALEAQYREDLSKDIIVQQELEEEETDELEEESSEAELGAASDTLFETMMAEYVHASDKLEILRKSITSRPPARILTENPICERLPRSIIDLRMRYAGMRREEVCGTLNSMGLLDVRALEMQDQYGPDASTDAETEAALRNLNLMGRPGTQSSATVLRTDRSRAEMTVACPPSSLARPQPVAKYSTS